MALVGHVLCRTLLLRCADAVESGAGTRRLDRLGGLIHRMPIAAGTCLAGLFAAAVLPPSPGFAAFWLLFQSLLAAARIGGVGLQLLILCAAVLTALSVGVAALAAVRLFGVVFLGRPRTPRTAAAEQAPRPVRLVLCGLAAMTTLLGLLPALALLPAARWTHATGVWSFATLRTGAETPGYSPVVVVGLLAVAGIAVLRAMRGSGQQQREPAWSGGFAAPPPWLPFGDPATQYGPASFVEPMQRVLVLPLPIAALGRQFARCRDAVSRAASILFAP
ncbi:MAG TPA: proton-conducting transporter membrane subunit [Variovorax sp.]